MKLRYRIVRETQPKAPFNFDATFHKPAHFPSGDNDWEPGIRWQTFHFLSKDLGVMFKNLGSVDEPRVRMGIYSTGRLSDEFVEKFIHEVGYRYTQLTQVCNF